MTNTTRHTQGYTFNTAEQKAQAEAFFAEHGFEVEYRDSDDAITSYGAEYFCEALAGSDVHMDDDGECEAAGIEAAHDINTDDMDYLTAHGQYNVDALCYAPLDVRDLRDTRGALANMDTRDEQLKANRARRAEQLASHLSQPAKGYGKQVAEGKANAKAKASQRGNRLARRVAAAEARKAR